MVNIKIERVFISLCKSILDKLKSRIEEFKEEKTEDFIETNPKIVLEDYTLADIATVTD